MLENEPRFHVVLATCDELPVGFISYWAFDSFTYIEHLAVEPSQRGKGHGSGLMRQVASLGRPLLLEVEPPLDEETRRRIVFYQHLGLALQDGIKYVQPPYSPGKPSVPLCLMTSPGMTRESINAAVITLRSEVYRYK
ncbi:MAG: GNAT family N-acetyltransferase [Muribaculaceae bacterium]|nr:GNAT family N-acetyltransferase [Muribaculaceae bacterium]